MADEYIKREDAVALLSCFTEIDPLGNTPKVIAEHLPAADVAPVVHARWKFNKLHNGFNCSECGRFERNREPFCNCGADMREEVADNG